MPPIYVSCLTHDTSSVTHQDGLYVVPVDLFRIASAAELAEALVGRTIANRSVLRRILHQTREAGRMVADAAGVSPVVKSKTELGEELEIAFTPELARRDPDRYLDYALALPGRIAKADSKRVVVFFDEFQEIASSIEHLMRDLFTPKQRALSQFGSFHGLRPIAPDDWAKGLRARFDLDSCEIDELALLRLVELGAGHPRATMLIAQRTHLTSVLLDTRNLDLITVEQGYRAAIDGERVTRERVSPVVPIQVRPVHSVCAGGAGDISHAGGNVDLGSRGRGCRGGGVEGRVSVRRQSLL